MKQSILILALAAMAASAGAQTQPRSSTTPAKPSTGTSTATGIKLPPGVPPGKGIIKTAFTVSLRYQDLTVGTGPVFDPKMMCTVKYTIYRASDGAKFDSTDDHRMPVRGADGKPVMGPDGKPKLGDPVPVTWLLDSGRLPVAVDQGFDGMKVGGKRRLFVPWQLGLGARAIPDRGPDHPGLPAKSNLIWDVELVSMSAAPAPPTPGARPMPPMPNRPPAPAAPGQPAPSAPPASPPPGAAATPAPPASPQSPGSPAAQPPSASPAQPQQPQQK
jgi:peptidylprolyl isomerase